MFGTQEIKGKTWNPDFFELPRETKIGLKDRVVREIGDKNDYSVRLRRKNDFRSDLSGTKKIKGSRDLCT